jgi:hypothetical protein
MRAFRLPCAALQEKDCERRIASIGFGAGWPRRFFDACAESPQDFATAAMRRGAADAKGGANNAAKQKVQTSSCSNAQQWLE